MPIYQLHSLLAMLRCLLLSCHSADPFRHVIIGRGPDSKILVHSWGLPACVPPAEMQAVPQIKKGLFFFAVILDSFDPFTVGNEKGDPAIWIVAEFNLKQNVLPWWCSSWGEEEPCQGSQYCYGKMNTLSNGLPSHGLHTHFSLFTTSRKEYPGPEYLLSTNKLKQQFSNNSCSEARYTSKWSLRELHCFMCGVCGSLSVPTHFLWIWQPLMVTQGAHSGVSWSPRTLQSRLSNNHITYILWEDDGSGRTNGRKEKQTQNE